MIRHFGTLVVEPLGPGDLDWADRLDRLTIGHGTSDRAGVATGDIADATGNLADAPARWTALWDEAFQFVARAGPDRSPFALLTVYGRNRAVNTAFVAVAADPGARGTGLVALAFASLVDGLFQQWNLRAVHLELHDGAAVAVRSAIGPILEPVGRLHEHYAVPGGFVDKVLLTVDRARWTTTWHEPLTAAAQGDRAARRALLAQLRATRHTD